MKITKSKKIFSTILLVAVFVNIFFLSTTEIHALSCIFFQSNTYVAAFEQGRYVDGFMVESEATGEVCGSRPVVSTRIVSLQNTFLLASQNLQQEVTSGVYQLATSCGVDEWESWCAKDTILVQLSSNSADLDRYKLEWQQKEQMEFWLSTIRIWSVAAIIVTAVVLAIFWPWILIMKRPHLRGRLSIYLIVAILLQAPLALILFATSAIGLGNSITYISSNVLALCILGEIIFLIVNKIKSKNVVV